MSLRGISHRAREEYIIFSRNNSSVERIRRQRVLPDHLFGDLTSKHYPSIFLDRRLRSIFDDELNI